MFKNIENGIIFKIERVDSRTTILGTKDRTHSMFVNPGSMESVFVAFEGDDIKGKTKK